MEYVEQLIVSFVSCLLFGIIFNVPRSKLVHCGFIGMVSWIIYLVLTNNGINMIVATGTASFFIAIICQLFSKVFQTPTIVFLVCGIFPLVPGALAYNAVLQFVSDNYIGGIHYTLTTFMVSGAIAIGLVLSEVVNQVIRNSKMRIVK